MTKKADSIQRKQQAGEKQDANPQTNPATKQKRKVFFTTIESLKLRKQRYEEKLKSLIGTQYKRKRANTLKVIMQLNRAINTPQNYVKDPRELELKRKKDRIRRIAKKLEVKRIKQIHREDRQQSQTVQYDKTN